MKTRPFTPKNRMVRPQVPSALRDLSWHLTYVAKSIEPDFQWGYVVDGMRRPIDTACRCVFSVVAHRTGHYSKAEIAAGMGTGHITVFDCLNRYKRRDYRPETLALIDAMLARVEEMSK